MLLSRVIYIILFASCILLHRYDSCVFVILRTLFSVWCFLLPVLEFVMRFSDSHVAVVRPVSPLGCHL